MSQHLDALAKANQVRLARADLKREIRRGDRTVDSVLSSPPEAVLGVTVASLLAWAPRWGTTRSRRLLVRLGIGEMRTVGQLTARQVGKLREYLA